MACSKMACSCSMCPLCGTNDCPKNNEPTYEYWIYVVNHKESYYTKLLATNDRSKLLPKLEKIRNKKEWSKCYKMHYVKDETGKFTIIYKDEIDITITQSEYGWYTAVRLILDLNTGKFLYSDTRKPWNGKIVFRNRK